MSPWFWLQERVSELVGDMISWQPRPKLTRSRFCFVSGRKHFCKFCCSGYDRISLLLCLVSCILWIHRKKLSISLVFAKAQFESSVSMIHTWWFLFHVAQMPPPSPLIALTWHPSHPNPQHTVQSLTWEDSFPSPQPRIAQWCPAQDQYYSVPYCVCVCLCVCVSVCVCAHKP